MYQIHNENGDVQRSDGAVIPNDPANRDWRKYQKYLADNPEYEPTPMDEPAVLVEPDTFDRKMVSAESIEDLDDLISDLLAVSSKAGVLKKLLVHSE